MLMAQRRRRFLWRHYLVPWIKNRHIHCLQRGKLIFAGKKYFAIETDFYRLKELSSADFAAVRSRILQQSPPDLRAAHEGWLAVFTELFRLRDINASSGRSDPALENKIKNAISNSEEELRASIEEGTASILGELRDRNTAFFAAEEGFSRFTRYLAAQYMRAKNIKASVLAAERGALPEFSLERAWHLMSHMHARNFDAVLARRRQDIRLTLLSTSPDAPFITGDQQVINTHETGAFARPAPDKLELYFPVSPSLAALVGDEADGPRPATLNVGPTDVDRYNRLMLDAAHEQVFSTGDDPRGDIALRKLMSQTEA